LFEVPYDADQYNRATALKALPLNVPNVGSEPLLGARVIAAA